MNINNIRLKQFIPSFILIFLLAFVLFNLPNKHSSVNAQTNGFTFGIAGDYGYAGGTYFQNTLNSMAKSNLNFVVATGDFAYAPDPDATSWDNAVLTTMGSSFPFELISGNHDAGYLDQYTKLVTNKISSISTDSLSAYGKLYYFDYPVTSPLMRFIMLGPNESPLNYTYAKNTTYYNWVSNAIDDARAKGIIWTAVAMHKNCITSGVKSCEIGTDILNLFVSKHVDLILQGHDHDYQRSYPLRNTASDPTSSCGVISVTFSSSCITKPTSNTYSRTLGSTLVIDGTGGKGLYTNTKTSEDGFFAAKSFSDWGFTKFTVSPSQISAVFVNNNTGGFTDSFIITNGASASTPTPTRTPTVNPPSPTTISCPQGDLNGDCHVDIFDYNIMIGDFGKTGSAGFVKSDINRDGKVDIFDYNILLSNFGK